MYKIKHNTFYYMEIFFYSCLLKDTMMRGMRIQKLAKRCLLYLSNNVLQFQVNGRKISSVSDHVEQ